MLLFRNAVETVAQTNAFLDLLIQNSSIVKGLPLEEAIHEGCLESQIHDNPHIPRKQSQNHRNKNTCSAGTTKYTVFALKTCFIFIPFQSKRVKKRNKKAKHHNTKEPSTNLKRNSLCCAFLGGKRARSLSS